MRKLTAVKKRPSLRFEMSSCSPSVAGAILPREDLKVELIFRRDHRAGDEVRECAWQRNRIFEIDPVDADFRIISELQLDGAAGSVGDWPLLLSRMCATGCKPVAVCSPITKRL